MADRATLTTELVETVAQIKLARERTQRLPLWARQLNLVLLLQLRARVMELGRELGVA